MFKKKNFFEGLNGFFACIHKSMGKCKKHECSGQLYSQIAYTIMTKCVCLKSQIFFSQSL